MSTEQSPALRKSVASALAAWAPPPRLLVSEWSGLYRHLSLEASAEPGLWRNSRAPHLVAPMDELSPYRRTEKVVCKFSSQTGKTEILLNFIGFIVDCDPGPILVMQPNVDPMGKAFSTDRVAPMLRDSPTLAENCGPAKSRSSTSTITHKSFRNGHLTIVGSNSAAGVSSRPIRYLLIDEIDRAEVTKEGDSIALGRKRQQTFKARRTAKELIVSSPTYKDVGVGVEYEKCKRTYEWHLQCLHCGKTQFPSLKHFITEKGPRYASYICRHCGSEHPLKQADKVKAKGRWVCTKDDGEASAGYWMNQFSSPFARWDDTIDEWLDAGEDPLIRQVVKNTAFAEYWEGEGDRVDPHFLEQREETYPAQAPMGVRDVTIGIDIQGDRAEGEIVGWGAGRESWSIDYNILPGEPTGKFLWNDIREFIETPIRHESGIFLNPVMVCIDAGYWAEQVYDFIKRCRDERIIPVKGSSVFAADAISGTKKDRLKRRIKRLAHGRPPEQLGVGQIKKVVMTFLAGAPGAPGYCHFPEGRGKEYYDQLTGERLTPTRKRGQRTTYCWTKIHPQVEALDCRVYAYAALLLADVDLDRDILQLPTIHEKKKPKSLRKPKALLIR